MVCSRAEYGAMVFRSLAYGATVCNAGPTAITPLMAAWLAAMVLRMVIPLAPPPAAATAWACRAAGALPGGKAASLVNSAGFFWITSSSGANFVALASWVLSAVAVAITDGGIFCAVATTDGGIFCAVATTPAWAVANAISLLYAVA